MRRLRTGIELNKGACLDRGSDVSPVPYSTCWAPRIPDEPARGFLGQDHFL